jgi:cell division septation protein DedD
LALFLSSPYASGKAQMIDISDGASVRNLEKIQEDSPQGSGKSATFALVVLSGACLLFATMAFGGRKTSTPASKKIDPLAELATKASTSPTILPGEVTFPGILSDKANPATAMAAATAGAAGSVPAPPPAGDKLPVVPLAPRHTMTATQLLGAPAAPSIAPAGASTVAKPYKDKLSALAEGDPAATGGSLAPSGAEGGWQVQVSSFKTSAEADVFANKLRARGHKAHVQKAEIPNRGTWYRVKIGPFSTQNEAIRYRTSFEAKEKMPGFVLKSE